MISTENIKKQENIQMQEKENFRFTKNGEILHLRGNI